MWWFTVCSENLSVAFNQRSTQISSFSPSLCYVQYFSDVFNYSHTVQRTSWFQTLSEIQRSPSNSLHYNVECFHDEASKLELGSNALTEFCGPANLIKVFTEFTMTALFSHGPLQRHSTHHNQNSQSAFVNCACVTVSSLTATNTTHERNWQNGFEQERIQQNSCNIEM